MVSSRISNIFTGKWWSEIRLVLLVAIAGGCSSFSSNQDQSVDVENSSAQIAGVQLWAENCIRCHNIRPPDSYSDTQWDVAMLHMRVRANLTAGDARTILDYLKSAD